MKLLVRYRIQEFPSEEKDAQIIQVVGQNYLSSREIDQSAKGVFRVLRFVLPSREDAYYDAGILEQEVKGLAIDLEPIPHYHAC